MATCIFCGVEFTPSGQGEHIIPDAIGGGITIDEVCHTCNTGMNKKYDEKFIKHDLITLARESLDIGSRKRTKASSILHKGGDTPIGTVKLDENYNPILFSKFAISSDETGEITILGHLQKGNEDDLIRFLKKKLPSELRRLHPDATDDFINEKVSETCNKAIQYCKDSKNIQSIRPEIKLNANVNPDIILKFMVKVAYEFAFHIHGPEYLNDIIASQLRCCLKSDSSFETLHGSFQAGFIFPTSADRHYILLIDHGCYVSLFGFNAFLLVSQEKRFFVKYEDGVVFEIDPTTKSTRRINFLDFIINNSNGFTFGDVDG